MKYTIDYFPEKEFVSIKMRGRLNFQVAEEYSKEAIKLGHHNLCSKFLIDHQETILQKGITNVHATGDELQQFGFVKTDRIAIIVNKLNGSRKILEPENRNTSWSNFKYFSSNKVDKALDWLLESE